MTHPLVSVSVSCCSRQDILIGLLRLRKPSAVAFRPEIRPGEASVVRELHVYGSAVPIHDRDPNKFQHQVRGREGGAPEEGEAGREGEGALGR